MRLELEYVSSQRHVETRVSWRKHDLPPLIANPSYDQGRGTVGRQENKRAAVTRRGAELSSLNLNRRAGNRLSRCLVRHSARDATLSHGRRGE